MSKLREIVGVLGANRGTNSETLAEEITRRVTENVADLLKPEDKISHWRKMKFGSKMKIHGFAAPACTLLIPKKGLTNSTNSTSSTLG